MIHFLQIGKKIYEYPKIYRVLYKINLNFEVEVEAS